MQLNLKTIRDIEPKFDVVPGFSENIGGIDIAILPGQAVTVMGKENIKGVPIGNLTSQHLANFYLAHADHLIKDRLRLPGYIRYMDDMLLFSNSAEKLNAVHRQLVEFVNNRLDLVLKPPVTGRCLSGVPFLGFIVKPKGIFLSRRKRRLARIRTETGFRLLESGRWDQEEFSSHLEPVFAHIALARSLSFRQNLLKRRDQGQ